MDNRERILQELLELKTNVKEMEDGISSKLRAQYAKINKMENTQELIAKSLEMLTGEPIQEEKTVEPTTTERFETVANKAEVEVHSVEEIQPVRAMDSIAIQVPEINYVEPNNNEIFEQTEYLEGSKQKENILEESPQQKIRTDNASFPADHERINYDSIQGEKSKPAQKTDRGDLEFKIGGIWLNRIAIVLIVLGMGFFLKYAFDNNWVSPTVRVLIGIMIGVGFLVAGEIFQNKKYQIFAQGLTGGGIAILYFSIFAGYYFFRELNVLPQPIAMTLMIIVTAVSVALAVRYDAKVIAFFGLAGGLLTPFLLSSGENNYMALYLYLLILNIGILAVAYYKKWTAVSNTSFVFTQIILLSCLISYMHDLDKMIIFSEAFLAIFFVLYLVIPLIYSAKNGERLTGGEITLLVANIILFAGESLVSFSASYPDFNGIFALTMAIVLGAVAFWYKQSNPQEKTAMVLLFGSAISLITLAIPLQMYKYDVLDFITLGWVIEAIVLLFAGFNIPSSKMRKAGIAILAIVSVKFFLFGIMAAQFRDIVTQNYVPILNKWSVEFLIINVGLFAAWYLYRKNYDSLEEGEKTMKNVFLLLANGFLFTQITMEISNIFLHKQLLINDANISQGFDVLTQGITSIVWSIYAVTLAYIGLKSKGKLLRNLAFMVIILAVGKLVFIDFFLSFENYPFYSLILNIKFISALVIAFILLLMAHLYKGSIWSEKCEEEKNIFNAIIMTAIILIGFAMTAENMRFFNSVGADFSQELNVQMQFGISSIWAIYSIILIVIGIAKRYKPVRLFAITLFGITILKVFLSDLSILAGVYRVLSFIVLGFILLTVSFLYQKYKDVIVYDLPKENSDLQEE